jgi:hypothetical protein
VGWLNASSTFGVKAALQDSVLVVTSTTPNADGDNRTQAARSFHSLHRSARVLSAESELAWKVQFGGAFRRESALCMIQRARRYV